MRLRCHLFAAKLLPALSICIGLSISTASWSESSVFQSLRQNSQYRPELALSVGKANQTVNDPQGQINSMFELGINLWHSHYQQRHEVVAGLAFGQLRSNYGPIDQLSIYTLMPQYRYHVQRQMRLPVYLVLGVGPSLMTEHSLGLRTQGSQFIFNTKIGLGTFLDRHQRWAIELAWRHYSNANLSKPNPGIDIPITLTLGVQL
ncbi:MAG: acyloxyacyl hydrolase [Halopseudomonas sp.]